MATKDQVEATALQKLTEEGYELESLQVVRKSAVAWIFTAAVSPDGHFVQGVVTDAEVDEV